MYLKKCFAISVIFVLGFLGNCSKNPVKKQANLENLNLLYTQEIYYPTRHFLLTLTDLDGKESFDVFKVENGYITHPSFSPDGQRIIFNLKSDTSALALYSIDINGDNLNRLSKEYPDFGYFPINYPVMLSNNINVIYYTRTSTDNYQIINLNTDTKEEELIVEGELFVDRKISNNDDWVIFHQDGYIKKVNIHTKEVVNITSDSICAGESWLNSTTNEIVFRYWDKDAPRERNIARINLDGTGLVKYNFGGQFPVMSNNGEYYLYVAVVNDETSICIAKRDGSNNRVLVSHWTWDNYFQFSKDDEKVIFVRNEDDHAIFSCDLNGESLTQITPFTYYGFWFPQLKPE